MDQRKKLREQLRNDFDDLRDQCIKFEKRFQNKLKDHFFGKYYKGFHETIS